MLLYHSSIMRVSTCFFFNDTATTEIYTVMNTLSLHDALPICTRLDERDLVAQLVRLAHVVRRQHDRHPPLGPEVGDVTADAHGHVRVEAERRLVEKEELGVVHERLGERDTLLEPRRELAVGRPPVGAELAELDQLVDAPSELLPAEPVEAAVERDDLPDAQ